MVTPIEVSSLTRRYRTTTGTLRRKTIEVEAVRGVSFEVGQGELFGLLGPNGAGKTTIIKILTTVLLPTSGSARVLGNDVVRQTRQVRSCLGHAFGGDHGLYLRMSAWDNLRYFAELYGVPPREQRRKIAESLEGVGLRGRESERVEGYSRGMRQRLHIARAILHDPPIIILDEPTIGLDPVGARELRATIASLTEMGKTVLLTTHYMFEADALCHRLAVLLGGRIVAEGTSQALKARVADRTIVEIETFGADPEAIGRLRRVRDVQSVSVDEREHAQLIRVQSAKGVELAQELLSRLNGTKVGRVAVREPTLEDAYLDLVSEGAR